ncbi:hypothetical protein Y032_0002g811 [Ancylostoma ceylanicum]|uniref:Uncharacterized protein n=1 Tax=Ancylostoma ceylanicum TaxID=53326 RepID=A0A016W388_9BILA|nr:hypothetical protein Y032_0002g811 [Ancylostoma ceylanicum]
MIEVQKQLAKEMSVQGSQAAGSRSELFTEETPVTVLCNFWQVADEGWKYGNLPFSFTITNNLTTSVSFLVTT